MLSVSIFKHSLQQQKHFVFNWPPFCSQRPGEKPRMKCCRCPCFCLCADGDKSLLVGKEVTRLWLLACVLLYCFSASKKEWHQEGRSSWLFLGGYSGPPVAELRNVSTKRLAAYTAEHTQALGFVLSYFHLLLHLFSVESAEDLLVLWEEPREAAETAVLHELHPSSASHSQTLSWARQVWHMSCLRFGECDVGVQPYLISCQSEQAALLPPWHKIKFDL